MTWEDWGQNRLCRGKSGGYWKTYPAGAGIVPVYADGIGRATALYIENDICARNGGYNLLLDKVFQNNVVDMYENCGLILTLAGVEILFETD